MNSLKLGYYRMSPSTFKVIKNLQTQKWSFGMCGVKWGCWEKQTEMNSAVKSYSAVRYSSTAEESCAKRQIDMCIYICANGPQQIKVSLAFLTRTSEHGGNCQGKSASCSRRNWHSMEKEKRHSAEAIPLSNHPYACCSLKTQLSYQGQLLNQGFSLYTTDLILLQQSLGSVIFHYIICRRDEVSMWKDRLFKTDPSWWHWSQSAEILRNIKDYQRLEITLSNLSSAGPALGWFQKMVSRSPFQLGWRL